MLNSHHQMDLHKLSLLARNFIGNDSACLEGIAYRNDRISEEKMRELAKPMLKNQYGHYLLKIIDEMKGEVNSLTITYPKLKD